MTNVINLFQKKSEKEKSETTEQKNVVNSDQWFQDNIKKNEEKEKKNQKEILSQDIKRKIKNSHYEPTKK